MIYNHAPSSRGSWLDRLVLALAIAGLSDGSETFDLNYADDLVLVYDTWLNQRLAAPCGRANRARYSSLKPRLTRHRR